MLLVPKSGPAIPRVVSMKKRGGKIPGFGFFLDYFSLENSLISVNSCNVFFKKKLKNYRQLGTFLGTSGGILNILH